MVTEQPDEGAPNNSNQQWFCGAQGFSILGFIPPFDLKSPGRTQNRVWPLALPGTYGDMYENADHSVVCGGRELETT